MGRKPKVCKDCETKKIENNLMQEQILALHKIRENLKNDLAGYKSLYETKVSQLNIAKKEICLLEEKIKFIAETKMLDLQDLRRLTVKEDLIFK